METAERLTFMKQIGIYLLNPDVKKSHRDLIWYFWSNGYTDPKKARTIDEVSRDMSKYKNNVSSDLKTLSGMNFLDFASGGAFRAYYLPKRVIRFDIPGEFASLAEKLQGKIRSNHNNKSKKPGPKAKNKNKTYVSDDTVGKLVV